MPIHSIDLNSRNPLLMSGPHEAATRLPAVVNVLPFRRQPRPTLPSYYGQVRYAPHNHHRSTLAPPEHHCQEVSLPYLT